ncbi:pyridoxamine 5'-phosphate oxidase family protein [Paenibacillus dakarensis]|uniref:pyridoxamine 5'-phosphate oxidase family protein n=1 Tax=Paenibacillus dakarensis TaxID=1527293 RepID=UPI0006D57285|nr:pyridoxamine 5'-phosphate oxidase family protein [Paenibacillus dakarensis]
MMNQPFKDKLTSEEEIRELVGSSSPLVMKKTVHAMDIHCMDFICKSPMIFISTSDNKGKCDVSPRGDHPGFIHIIDHQHFVIPERPGNRRLDSILNILSNPHIGVIFIIPQLEETLRINGRACVIKDADLLESMKVNGKAPSMGIGVTVEECYMHCAKAFKRSKLWDPESWSDVNELPKPAKILAAHAGAKEDEVARSLKESYEKRLY